MRDFFLFNALFYSLNVQYDFACFREKKVKFKATVPKS